MALKHVPSESEKTILLGSMEDLIKVADELAKPIIYQEPGLEGGQHIYSVMDGTTRYQYSLSRIPELAIKD